MLFWDVSLSMENRNINGELDYLNNFFKADEVYDLTLIKFNSEVVLKKQFKLLQGDWNELKEELINSVYDGATSYQCFDEVQTGERLLIFSDGNENMARSKLPKGAKTTFVNAANPYSADIKKKLKEHQVETVDLIPEKPEILEGRTLYTGTVYTKNAPLAGANVQIKNSARGAVTDINGNFEIYAEETDTLVFSYLGKGLQQKMPDKNGKMDVWLDHRALQLDEVVVEGELQKQKEQQNTGYGKKDKDRVGYAVSTVKSGDINSVETTTGQALNGKVSGLNVGPTAKAGQSDLSKAVIRGISSFKLTNHPLIVIDGVPLNRSQPSNEFNSASNSFYDFIDPNNIHEITVLKGLAASNRYGSLGNNGVILITTKTAYAEASVSGKKDKKAPEYIEKVKEKEALYITDIRKQPGTEEKYETYLTYRSLYGRSPSFYINVYKALKEQIPEEAGHILMNIVEKYEDRPHVLRMLAYTLEEDKKYKLATEIYERIRGIEEGKVQALLDQANIDALNKKPKEAFIHLAELRADKSHNNYDLKKLLVNDIRHLVRNSPELRSDPEVPAFFKSNVNYAARIVFEWNDPNAEFNLQFIDPKKNYSDWEHSRNDAQQFTEHQKTGLLSQEYIIEEGPKGMWLINLKYLGNGSSEPSYFKVKLINNFGKPNEHTEIRYFSARETGLNQNILKLYVN